MKPSTNLPNTTDDGQRFCAPREILLQSAMFRLGEVENEIRSGYEVLRKYHKTVTIFGSARIKETNKYYKLAMAIAKKLSNQGYTIITGGGGGIMEASNRGAFEANGNSVGFNIKLPHEQSLNSHTTDSFSFQHFEPRKIVMTLYADAYIFFPGGFGTLDELGEILTLVQTGKTTKAPIVLFGSEFWHLFNEFICTEMRDKEQLITPGDESIYTITDDIDEAVDLVLKNKTYCEH